MPLMQKWGSEFSCPRRVYLVLFTCVLVLAGQYTIGPAIGASGSHDGAALQNCPAVQDEIVDLQILAEGLKKSRAVGFFEKLSLKSAIDDLLRRFQGYHSGSKEFSLEELQQQYDLLLMRIATHLQHKDILLHQQLCNAWDMIWEDLSDPGRFSEKFS
jgi:hypothetical protein